VHVPALRASPGGRYRQQAAFGATAKRDHMNHPPDLVFAAWAAAAGAWRAILEAILEAMRAYFKVWLPALT
jgi:hypothetical protein